MTNENFDRLLKICVSEILNSIFSKFHNPSENLAIDEVFVSFKGRVIFKLHTKETRFSIKIFELCDSTGYTRHGSIPGEGQTAQHFTATHVTVTELIRKVGRDHIL